MPGNSEASSAESFDFLKSAGGLPEFPPFPDIGRNPVNFAAQMKTFDKLMKGGDMGYLQNRHMSFANKAAKDGMIQLVADKNGKMYPKRKKVKLSNREGDGSDSCAI